MDMSQIKFVTARHERHAEHRRHGRQQLDRERRPARPQPRPRPRKQALLGLASTQLGVPVASLTRRARASSRAAARPSPTAQLIGGKLFNVTMAGDDAQPGPVRRRSRSARTSWSATRACRAIDIPAKVTGQLHLRAQRPRPRDAARPGRPAARPGRRTATARLRVAVASTRARSSTSRARRSSSVGQLPRRRRAEGVRRDPGGGAAEGDVGRPADDLPGSGNLWKQMRDFDSAGPGAGADRGATRATSTRRSPRRPRRRARRRYTLPVQRPHADRPDAARSPT